MEAIVRGRPASFKGQTKVLASEIPAQTKELAKKYAAEHGINLNEVVNRALLRLVA